jgi:hypothetical protein
MHQMSSINTFALLVVYTSIKARLYASDCEWQYKND